VADECGNNVHLVIMGQGPYESYLKEVIHENNLETCVTLLPYQKNPFAILNKCDVFVMPSMFEGYCNALCEALICGLPCIATDFQSSAREILAPNTSINYQIKEGIEYAEYGILTPVCSGTKYRGSEPLENAEQFLTNAMLKLYKDKERFENYKSKAYIRAEQLGINRKVQEWMELI
jgi:glycosyltransferase involved in cell wall biosynthesis